MTETIAVTHDNEQLSPRSLEATADPDGLTWYEKNELDREKDRERWRQSGTDLSYENWCARESERAYEATQREKRANPRGFVGVFVDLDIEQGRLSLSARRVAIEYGALNMAGRTLAADRYLHHLVQRRKRTEGSRLRLRHHLPPQRHVRARCSHRVVAKSAGGDSGDGDPEPEPPSHRRAARIGRHFHAPRILGGGR